MKKAKFRVAREGATTDGRKISREWLEQMAKNYDPKVYGARINLEHFKSLYPDSAFRAYGDVLSLSTEEENGLLYLVAEISPNQDLIELNKRRQKVYTSIEVDPSFADTGEAYLVGLAVTDSPASLGTEMLEFSSKASVNPLADRKTNANTLFAEAIEFSLDIDEKQSLIDTMKAIFKSQTNERDFSALRQEFTQAAELLSREFETFKAGITSQLSAQPTADEFTTLKQAHDDLNTEFNALKKRLEEEPNRQHLRSQATGSDNVIKTDC